MILVFRLQHGTFWVLFYAFCFVLFYFFMFGICFCLLRKQTLFVTEWGGVSCETVAFLGVIGIGYDIDGDLEEVLWVWVGFIFGLLKD